jgi:hypothetical protein
MTLRINARRGTGAAYVQRLAAHLKGATLLEDPGLARPGRGAGRTLPGAATARLCRRRAVGAGRSGPASSRLPVDWRRRVHTCKGRAGARRLRRPRRQDGPPAGTGRTGPAGAGQRPGAPDPGAGHAEPAATQGPAQGRRRARPARLVGRQALRRHPAGRPLHGQRHRAPPPRRALAAPGRRRGRAGPHPGRDAAGPVAAAGPWRAAAVRHLLVFKAEGQHQSMHFCNAWARGWPCCKNSHPAICWPAATIHHREFPAAALRCRTGFSMP